MPHRMPWDPAYSVGHDPIDAQHRGLLIQCNRLADLCQAPQSDERDRQFDEAVELLKALARAHFETEASLLASLHPAGLEDHQIEVDEFDHFADEVATTAHFDRLELQRFLALWCLGHVTGSAQQWRALLGGGNPPA